MSDTDNQTLPGEPANTAGKKSSDELEELIAALHPNDKDRITKALDFHLNYLRGEFERDKNELGEEDIESHESESRDAEELLQRFRSSYQEA